MKIAPGPVQQETKHDRDKYIGRDCGDISYKGSTGPSELALPANAFIVIEIAWLETTKSSRSRSRNGRKAHLDCTEFHDHCRFNAMDREFMGRIKDIQYHTLSRRILSRPQSVVPFVLRGRQPTDDKNCSLARRVRFPECRHKDCVPNSPTINANFGTITGGR